MVEVALLMGIDALHASLAKANTTGRICTHRNVVVVAAVVQSYVQAGTHKLYGGKRTLVASSKDPSFNRSAS